MEIRGPRDALRTILGNRFLGGDSSLEGHDISLHLDLGVCHDESKETRE